MISKVTERKTPERRQRARVQLKGRSPLTWRMIGVPAPVFPGFDFDILDRVPDDEKPDAVWHRDRARGVLPPPHPKPGGRLRKPAKGVQICGKTLDTGETRIRAGGKLVEDGTGLEDPRPGTDGQDLGECLRRGAIAGGLTCLGPGAQESVPDQAMIESRIAEISVGEL